MLHTSRAVIKSAARLPAGRLSLYTRIVSTTLMLRFTGAQRLRCVQLNNAAVSTATAASTRRADDAATSSAGCFPPHRSEHPVLHQEEKLIDAAVGARVTTGGHSSSTMIGDAWRTSDASKQDGDSVRAVSGDAAPPASRADDAWVSPHAPLDITPIARAWGRFFPVIDDLWSSAFALPRRADLTADPSRSASLRASKRSPMAAAHVRALSGAASGAATDDAGAEDVSKAGTLCHVAGSGSTCAATDAMASAPTHVEHAQGADVRGAAARGREKLGVLPVEAHSGMKDIEDPAEHFDFVRAAAAASSAGPFHPSPPARMRVYSVSAWPHESTFLMSPRPAADAAIDEVHGLKQGGALAFAREQAQDADDARVVSFEDETPVPRHRWSRSQFNMVDASEANPYLDDIVGGTESGRRPVDEGIGEGPRLQPPALRRPGPH